MTPRSVERPTSRPHKRVPAVSAANGEIGIGDGWLRDVIDEIDEIDGVLWHVSSWCPG
jgi:hypothetical protein